MAMTSMEKPQFLALLATLAEVYGEASELRLQAYWMALRQYDLRDIEGAVERCLQTRRGRDGYRASWPTPADLIALMYRGLDDVSDPEPWPSRRALPEGPPDQEGREGIRALIRGVIESLPDSVGQRVTPMQQAAARREATPEERRSRLREMVRLGGTGRVGSLAALALQAGYSAEEVRAAIEADGQQADGQPWE